ncbi:unnamed protein product [Caenorhabditis brenneri]
MSVIQGKTIHSFALPRVQTHNSRKYEYWEVSETLCNLGSSGEELSEPVYLSITSFLPSTFNLSATSREDYRIETSKILSTSSPSEPSFYLYTFPDEVEKVNIRAYSESVICAKLIARRANCPNFDASGLLEWNDDFFYQTFTKLAVFSLKKSDIGSQFHLAVSVEPDDSNCESVNNENKTVPINSNRIKTTTISVIPVSAYLNYRWYDSCENNEPNIFEGTDSEGNVLVDKIKLFQSPHMIVSHHYYQKQRLVKDIKYFKFLFFQIFGSILPALTILFQNRPGPHNLDTCYLNYLCAQDVLSFYSFNAMSSSSSMAVIGILNLIIVFRKKIFRYQVPRYPKTHGIQKRDAPKVVFCLGLIAMGIPRMIIYNCQDKSTEHFCKFKIVPVYMAYWIRTSRIMSDQAQTARNSTFRVLIRSVLIRMRSYHVYATAWVNYAVIFWVYSRRHGTVKNSNFLHLLLKILFFLFTNSATGFFCYKYYYERPSGLRHYQWIQSPLDTSQKTLTTYGNEVYKPLKSKTILISVSMLYSIICSSVPLFTGCSVYSITDFYIQSQLTIYAVFYYIQKIRFEWRSFTLTYAVYTVFLTFLIAFFSCINFYLGGHKKTFSVSATPAQSREFNMECILPGIDWSHIRQYIGALVWFVYLLLMDYLDSNIKGVPKKHIFVF